MEIISVRHYLRYKILSQTFPDGLRSLCEVKFRWLRWFRCTPYCFTPLILLRRENFQTPWYFSGYFQTPYIFRQKYILKMNGENWSKSFFRWKEFSDYQIFRCLIIIKNVIFDHFTHSNDIQSVFARKLIHLSIWATLPDVLKQLASWHFFLFSMHKFLILSN